MMMEGRGPRVRRGSQSEVAEEIVPNSGWTQDPSGHCLLLDLPGFRKEEVKLEVDESGNIIVRGERLTNEEKRVHFELIFPVPMGSDLENIAGHFDSEILYVHVPKLIITSQENKEREIQEEEEAANGGNDVERLENDHHHNQEHIENADDGNEWRGQSSTQLHHHREREEKKNNESEYVEGFSEEEVIRKWERGSFSYGMSRSAAVEVLRRNKGVVVTAIIAFSFGLYVSHKFHSLTEAP